MSEPTARDVKLLQWAIAGAKLFSTCERAQYMALIVDKAGNIVGVGYNGGPSGWIHCDAGGCPRASSGRPHGDLSVGYTDCIAIHAEINALIRSDASDRRDGVTLVVGGAPCFECAKTIANARVERLVFCQPHARDDADRALQFLETSGVDLIECDA